MDVGACHETLEERKGDRKHRPNHEVSAVGKAAGILLVPFAKVSGVVCARQKWVICARQKLVVCARYFCVILSLYLCNMILLVDASSLHHHTTHHCLGFSSYHCLFFCF